MAEVEGEAKGATLVLKAAGHTVPETLDNEV